MIGWNILKVFTGVHKMSEHWETMRYEILYSIVTHPFDFV